MPRTARPWCWIGCVVVRLVSAGITAEAWTVEPLTIRTYDGVGLAAAELESARESGGHILERAGLAVIWLDCTAPRPSHVSAPCNTPLTPREIVVRILPAMAGIAPNILGSALVDRGQAVLATVYADRVRSLAAGAHTDAGQLMGRAAAHEVGHLLLGTTRHAASGLMRDGWDADKIRNGKPWDWYLADDEAAGMRRGLLARARVAEGLLAAVGLRRVPVGARLDGPLHGGLELQHVPRP